MIASRTTTLWGLVAGAVLASACTRTVVYQERNPKPVVVTDTKGGPPSHAPAHGYRCKHAKDNVVLVYDADVDVYVVSGYKNCWFSAGQYFRDTGISWEWSVSIEGPWKVVTRDSDVPPGLRHSGHKHGKEKKEKNKQK
jgi:hypothetical protein